MKYSPILLPIFFIVLFGFIPEQAHAAGIAYVNSEYGGQTGGSSYSFNSTDCSGNDTFALVQSTGSLSTDNITSVSYGGAAMTLVDKTHVSGDRWVYVWGLTHPASGVQTIAITANTSDYIGANEICYSGVRQSAQPEVETLGTSAATSTMYGNITTLSDNDWVVGTIYGSGNGSDGTAINGTHRIHNGIGGFMDSNGPISPAGPYSLGNTFTSGSQSAMALLVALQPAQSIAYVNSEYGGQTGGSSYSFNSTDCSGDDTFALVQSTGSLGTDNISSVTYGGTAMSLIDKTHVSGDRWVYMWALVNPATGTQAIILNGITNDYIGANEACYSGVSQTGQPEAENLTTSTATSTMYGNVTTITNDAWVIGTIYGSGNGSDGTAINGTLRIHNGIGGFMDSNGPVSPAGPYSLGNTFTSGSQAAMALLISLAPR